MSQRNSYAAKRSARERLRAEREREAKKARIKRQLAVAGGVVALLAIAGGVGAVIYQANQPGEWQAAATAKLVIPKNATGPDGTTVVIGNTSAKHTLAVAEDMRCPYCAEFEQTSGNSVLQGAAAGKYKISYTLADFLDKNLTGSGSKNALSALGAALNVSKQAFSEYHTVLYSKAVHPEETDDAFASDANLIAYARKVPALKGNAAFENAVRNGTYDRWALEMAKQFDKQGLTGTPTVHIDGKGISNPQNMTAAQFTAAVDKVINK